MQFSLHGQSRLSILAKVLPIKICALGIDFRTVLHAHDILRRHLSDHLGGCAHGQGMVGDFHALGHQSFGADQAVPADLGAVEHHRIDADQRAVAYGAAVDHRHMADGDMLTDHYGKARIGVENAAVLDVGAVADGDRLIVAAQHRMPPNAGFFPEFDLSYDHCRGCNPKIVAIGFDAIIAQGVTHGTSPEDRIIVAMSIAELAPIFEGPDKWPRVYGLFRSLVIYYGQPWRTAGLKRLYRPFMAPGDLMFDIGAHVGNRSRCWAGLGARVVAVEPQADFAAWLRWQFKGRDEIEIVETALAAEPGVASMHVDPTNPTVTTLSSDWIDNVTKTDSFKDVAWQAPVDVPVTTLDRLIDAHGLPVFCKIDVEGYEAEVLKGLSQPIKALSLEFLPAAIEVALESIDLLEALGRYRYNVSYGEGMAFDWTDWQSADRMRQWLAQQKGGQRSGDVYTRLES